jgi:hypothetical protein
MAVPLVEGDSTAGEGRLTKMQKLVQQLSDRIDSHHGSSFANQSATFRRGTATINRRQTLDGRRRDGFMREENE